MTQLTRIQPGKNIEEAHMRNRQLIAAWVYEKGKSRQSDRNEKARRRNFCCGERLPKLRALFGQLLAEIQRIRSTGDFEGGKKLVEAYAVKVDQTLHAEVLDRYKKLNLAPYRGFVNPV